MKKSKKIFFAVVLILLFLILGGSYFIGTQVVDSSTQLSTNEKTKGVKDSFWPKYGMNIQEFKANYPIEKLNLTSSLDGHNIPADYIYAKESQGSKDHPTVLLVHGLGGNRYTTYPFAEFFLEEGFNVLAYDQRSSNENTAQYTTFGYWEKFDLIDYLNYVKQQAPSKKIGLWGVSFGGATAGLALGYENTQSKVDFAILDSPVSSMEWMIEQEMEKMDIGIPVSYMTWWGNLANKMKFDFTYKDVDVPSAMKNVSIPLLIVNSTQDEMTPEFMGKDIYDALPEGNKELWTLDDSEHADVWLDHNEEYRNKMKALMEK